LPLVLETTIARASDPLSSHVAATEVTRSGRRALQTAEVLRLLKMHPGTTSRELAARTYLDRYVAARRLPEMIEGRLVRQGEARICAESGRLAVTWWPV
jgi:hypothetical protein